MNTAHLIVDMQNDFAPGGVLAVPAVDDVVENINNYMRRTERYKVASKDMHIDPGAHFVEYTPHCVKGTPGASFYPPFAHNLVDLIVEKGAHSAAPSAFDGYTKSGDTLHEALQLKGISAIEICGVMAEVCVLTTALDGLKLGYDVTLLVVQTAAANPEGMDYVIGEILMAGGHLA